MAGRSGCGAAPLWIVGLVLLIPGVCTLLLLNQAVNRSFSQHATTAAWIGGGTVVGGIIWLIIEFGRAPPDND
jgi:hypothetical protein